MRPRWASGAWEGTKGLSGVQDALNRSVQRPAVSAAALAASGPRPAPPSARRSGLARALLAALAIHAALLGALLIVRPSHLPEIAEPPAVSVVFKPEAPQLTPPSAPPAQPEQVQVPDLPTPPALAQAEPVPDIQALTPPAPEKLAPPPRLEPPRLARSPRPVPPPAPKHLQREPARPHAPPQLATAPAQSRPETGPQQQPPAQVASASSPSMGAWRNALMAWLEKHKKYPEAAREEEVEGRALVRFTASRDGRVLDASLAQSSGSRALDAAALNLVREMPLPPFPAGVTQDTLTVTLPLTYQIE